MANKQINELTEKSATLADDDLILVYDSEEAGSEKAKKVAISNYVATINSPVTLYVDPAGNDTTGDGSIGNPWATPNKAYEWLGNKYLSATVTIQCADGTYSMSSSTLKINHMQGNLIKLYGNTGTPSNCVFDFPQADTGFKSIVSVDYGCMFQVFGVKFTIPNTTNNPIGIDSTPNSIIRFNNSILDGFYYGILNTSSRLTATSSIITNCDKYGVAGFRNADQYLASCTISNTADVGAFSAYRSFTRLNNITFSGNNTNTSPANDTVGNSESYMIITT